MRKLYCYVDETGQDTKGQFFLVAVVLTGPEREELRNILVKIEASTNKGNKKWSKTPIAQKNAYLQSVLKLRLLHKKIFYAEFVQTTDYLGCVIIAVAKGIKQKVTDDYKATVLIDGLDKAQRKIVGARLRRAHIRIDKVRGLREQSDELIRLADAIAGFVRAGLEGKSSVLNFYQMALRQGIIKKLQ